MFLTTITPTTGKPSLLRLINSIATHVVLTKDG